MDLYWLITELHKIRADTWDRTTRTKLTTLIDTLERDLEAAIEADDNADE